MVTTTTIQHCVVLNYIPLVIEVVAAAILVMGLFIVLAVVVSDIYMRVGMLEPHKINQFVQRVELFTYAL